MRIEFEMLGKPATQGSKRSFPQFRGGKPMTRPDGRLVIRTQEDSADLEAWRADVAVTARRVFESLGGDGLLQDAARLGLHFYRPRPKTHFGTGCNAGKLKPSAPKYPTSTPDTLKLARAIEDALTGVVWRDDSQVCRHELAKDWGNCFRVTVVVETLDDCPLLDGNKTAAKKG